MAIARSLSQPSMYVKINQNFGVFGIEGQTIFDEDGTIAEVIKPKVKIVLSYTKYKSYAERLESDLPGAMIWSETKSVELIINADTLQPQEGWQGPSDSDFTSMYWMLASIYPVFKSQVTEFSDYVDFQ